MIAHAQSGLVGEEREHGGDPQQDREHVDEVRAEPPPHRHGLLGGEHVLAELREARGGLFFGRALAAGRAELRRTPLGRSGRTVRKGLDGLFDR